MFLKSQFPWAKMLAEFIAITVAVYLGLLADNYREHRSDTAREEEYLQLLAEDLSSDLESLERTRTEIEKQAHAADLINRTAGGEKTSVAELEKALAQLFLTWTYDAPRPTYLVLRSGLGLHIISDHEIRSTLTQYYEVDQMRLQQDYMSNYNAAQRRLRRGLGRHVRLMPPEEFDSLSLIPQDFHAVRLLSDPTEMAADIEFMNDIAEQGARAFELVAEIDRVKSANRAARAKFEVH